MMHGFGIGGFGWIGMILYLIITIVVVVGIIWLITWLVQKGFSKNQMNFPPSHLNPREIIQTRYARGEITREQYQQMLEDLS